jgi:hypothetical protein
MLSFPISFPCVPGLWLWWFKHSFGFLMVARVVFHAAPPEFDIVCKPSGTQRSASFVHDVTYVVQQRHPVGVSLFLFRNQLAVLSPPASTNDAGAVGHAQTDTVIICQLSMLSGVFLCPIHMYASAYEFYDERNGCCQPSRWMDAKAQ